MGFEKYIRLEPDGPPAVYHIPAPIVKDAIKHAGEGGEIHPFAIVGTGQSSGKMSCP